MLIETGPFAGLEKNYYGALLVDPPWHFECGLVDKSGRVRHPSQHYRTMKFKDICALPVADLAADNAVLFIWVIWPMLEHGLKVISEWGFTYKSCAFNWVKADGRQVDLFHDDIISTMGMGFWTRADSEVCLLATRGKPKRLDGGVRQGIIEPRRQHSRKPSCVHERIERLVAGPYLELFARQIRPGWDCWGDQTDKFPGRGRECA